MDATTVHRPENGLVDGDVLLDVDTVAAGLGVTAGTVYRWISDGVLPATQLGGRRHGPIRIPASSLNAVLAGWRTRA